ncbi:MAG: twin-arginine translocase TatA/TatE family subunit [Candidatus Dormiibacterota bacterium]
MGLVGGHLPEIIILLVVILIVWGPGKLPDIGAAVGKGIREFRTASSEADDSVTEATRVATSQSAEGMPTEAVNSEPSVPG